MTGPTPPPDVGLPALLRQARRTYAGALRTALAGEGHDHIPANGLYLIGALAQADDGLAIGSLVQSLGITKQATGQLVDALLTRGYVRREPDAHDRRRQIVALTERGRAAARTQGAARREIDAALLAAVGETDLAATRRTLAALIDIGRAPTRKDAA